ncbi:MAG: phage portal protein, partial [Phycisphaerales bacterium]
MGLLQALGIGRKASPRRRPIVARYDAAQTTAENRRHWSNADALSADAALDPTVRNTLRVRSRYECANNSYAAGIVRTLGDDTIGTGVRLQITADDRAANSAVEQSFARWADAIDLSAKLRLMRMTRARDGEAFAVMVNNPRLREQGLPSLDVQLIEADQVYAPFGADVTQVEPTRNVDGVVIDSLGIPVAYTVAEIHPGSNGIHAGIGRCRRLPASA